MLLRWRRLPVVEASIRSALRGARRCLPRRRTLAIIAAAAWLLLLLRRRLWLLLLLLLLLLLRRRRRRLRSPRLPKRVEQKPEEASRHG